VRKKTGWAQLKENINWKWREDMEMKTTDSLVSSHTGAEMGSLVKQKLVKHQKRCRYAMPVQCTVIYNEYE
jgi:hypothetical protein